MRRDLPRGGGRLVGAERHAQAHPPGGSVQLGGGGPGEGTCWPRGGNEAVVAGVVRAQAHPLAVGHESRLKLDANGRRQRDRAAGSL